MSPPHSHHTHKQSPFLFPHTQSTVLPDPSPFFSQDLLKTPLPILSFSSNEPRTKYTIKLNNNQTWLLYISSSIDLTNTNTSSITSNGFSDIVRIAILPESDPKFESVFDRFSSCYPGRRLLLLQTRFFFAYSKQQQQQQNQRKDHFDSCADSIASSATIPSPPPTTSSSSASRAATASSTSSASPPPTTTTPSTSSSASISSTRLSKSSSPRADTENKIRDAESWRGVEALPSETIWIFWCFLTVSLVEGGEGSEAQWWISGGAEGGEGSEASR